MYLYEPGDFQPLTGPATDPLGCVALTRPDSSELNMTSDGTGTWLLTGAPGLIGDTPDLRLSGTPAARAHGETNGEAWYGARDFDLIGRIVLDDPLDLAAAHDHLARFLGPAARTVLVRRPGWAGPRSVTARPAGRFSIVPADPEDEDPWPAFTVPMRAADPRLYGPTDHDLTDVLPAGAASVDVPLVDPGTFPGVPWRVSFPAGTVDPAVEVVGTGIAFSMTGYTVPAGKVLVFNSGLRTVTVEGGSVLGYLDGELADLPEDAATVRLSQAAGSAGGQVRVRYREAYL